MTYDSIQVARDVTVDQLKKSHSIAGWRISLKKFGRRSRVFGSCVCRCDFDFAVAARTIGRDLKDYPVWNGVVVRNSWAAEGGDGHYRAMLPIDE